MRRSTFGVIASIGLGLCVATGDVGCATKTHDPGFGVQTATAKPILDEVPASALTSQAYGIASWKVFMGRSQLVYEAYDRTGAAVQGCQFAWFKASTSTPAHLRIMMLDGSGAAMRVSAGPTLTGSFSASQTQFLLHAGYDFQELLASQGTLAPASVPGAATGAVRLDWTWVGVGSYVAAGAGTVILGGVALATLPVTAGALVVGGVVAGTALGVAAAGMGLYSYVTENPNTPATPAPACQVDSSQDGQLSASDTTDPSMSGQTFDQQWNQDMDALNSTQTCPSCSDPSSDLNVNPQNGDVSPDSSTGDPGAASGGDGNGDSPTSDSTDTGGGGGDPSGSSSGSGDDGTGSSSGGTGGDGTQDDSQDQGSTQDQGETGRAGGPADRTAWKRSLPAALSRHVLLRLGDREGGWRLADDAVRALVARARHLPDGLHGHARERDPGVRLDPPAVLGARLRGLRPALVRGPVHASACAGLRARYARDDRSHVRPRDLVRAAHDDAARRLLRAGAVARAAREGGGAAHVAPAGHSCVIRL